MRLKFNLYMLLGFVALISCTEKAKTPPNILFISIDDLRPELKAYGAQHIHSPNLDRLADEGFLFMNHYVTVPTCGASRYGLMTGMYPREKRHLSNNAFAFFMADREEGPEPESFVHALRKNGYYTVGIGKLSHSPDGYVYGYQEPKSDKPEMPYSWDEMLFDAGKWGTGHNAFFGYADGSNRNDRNKEVKPYESAVGGDEIYPDGLTASLALKKLDSLSEIDQPFFLGVGFFKPHLPFNSPEEYWEKYDREEIPLASDEYFEEEKKGLSLHGSGEFNQYKLGKEKASLSQPLSDAYARKIKHAYAASISYVDAQVGRILGHLEELGLQKNTIVIVWGDHGWHLGEQRVWGKHTLMESALRSAFIVRHPSYSGDVQIDQIISTVDIYPSILEWCGIDAMEGLDGSSIDLLLKNPDDSTWRNEARSFWGRGESVRTALLRETVYDFDTVEVKEVWRVRE